MGAQVCDQALAWLFCLGSIGFSAISLLSSGSISGLHASWSLGLAMFGLVVLSSLLVQGFFVVLIGQSLGEHLCRVALKNDEFRFVLKDRLLLAIQVALPVVFVASAIGLIMGSPMFSPRYKATS